MKKLAFYAVGTAAGLGGIWAVSAAFGLLFRLLGVA